MTGPDRVGPLAARREREATLRQDVDRLVSPRQPPAGALPVVLLPANTREVTPLPDDARDAFVRHLRRQLTRAFVAPARDGLSPRHDIDGGMPAEPDDLEGPAADSGDLRVGATLGAACGTCAGACCTAGGTHAFLKAASLVRVRDALAGAHGPPPTAAMIEAQYAAALPTDHYRDSCVFHAPGGCTLPRTLRSNLCNRYLCGGLSQLTRALAASGDSSAFVAAADSAGLQRLARVTLHGAQPLTLPLTPPRTPPRTPPLTPPLTTPPAGSLA